LNEEHEKVARWAHGLDRELVETRQEAGTAARAQRKAAQQVVSLETRLADHEATHRKTEQELADARSECIKWQEAQAIEVRRAQEAQAELEAVRDRARNTEERLRERDDQLTQLTRHRTSTEAQAIELSGALDAARLELHAKQLVLDALQKEMEQLATQLDAASTALAEVTGDRQSLTTILAEAGDKSADLLQSLALSRQRIARLQEHVRDLSRPLLGGS
jgi:chromosome segregation ATPase